MTTIRNSKGEIVAQFTFAAEAMRCIGPMARALGEALTINPAPKVCGVDLAKNVTLFNSSSIQEQNRIIARP